MGLQSKLVEKSQGLQVKFEGLLGTRNVYYNPPENKKLNYDAIVFRRSRINSYYAGDAVYRQTYPFEVTVITTDPDAVIIDKISKLPFCSFDRSFVVDNLYHNIFTIYH